MAVRLEKMNADEYQHYLSYTVKHYAEEQIKSGNWEKQEAISKATAEHEKLLPNGEKTENNYLFTIRDGQQEVGMIWLAQISAEKGFIYDINIWEGNRGKGYGKLAMEEIESAAKKIGLKKIGLHVFTQ
ncbi:GNAT family N-acetyltransferase [Oceanobacillus sp. J11TS1]|uniref:GNAT family N-acetyltransferase n=1 Tax=Oceanobacillus sp. J11TS1 TaxID=2807191 RepID=UPI001B25FA50|nr:GNAT family N-acetyltransferase [Oceanobacillus sp. J11TS1]GIO23287.1 putative N-acetyltransferase YycN [Oceanobacillus sp. J11TS1]